MSETYGRSTQPRPAFHITLFAGRSLLLRKTWWFCIIAANGERVMVSETYSSADARNRSATRISEESRFVIANPGDC